MKKERKKKKRMTVRYVGGRIGMKYGD